MKKNKRNKEIEKVNKAAEKAKIALDAQLEKLSKLDEEKKLEEIEALKVEKEKLVLLKVEQDEKKEKEKEAKKEAKKKEKSSEIIDTPRKKFHALYTKKPKFTIKALKTWFKDRYMSSRTILINMELLNGMHDTFMVLEKDDGFHYRKKKFIFDNDAKYYNINAKLWSLDYHEMFALPIKRIIPVNKIKSSLESSNISEVEFATNPTTLERFIVAKIAEGIMRGQELDETLRRLMILLIITALVSLIHFLLFAQKTGIFEQIKIPGF